ncbi:MAG TPA: ferrochelatase [Planctomycetota bacterium]|nr:ferrochelatase [Planctomycetota bacterium]
MGGRNFAVILETYGEPAEAAFWPQYTYSYAILRKLTRRLAPIPTWLLPWISYKRARGRKAEWRAHDYTSPLETIHEKFCTQLRASLSEHTTDRWTVEPGYLFRPPQLETAVLNALARGVDRVFVVPMYSAESDFTHGLTEYTIGELAQRDGPNGKVARDVEIVSFSRTVEDERKLGALMLAQIETELRARDGGDSTKWKREKWGLALAAHGTVIDKPHLKSGLRETFRIYKTIASPLKDRFTAVLPGFLNHSGRGTWSRPNMTKTVALMKARGVERLVYYPFGFVADNSETQLEVNHFVGGHMGHDGKCGVQHFKEFVHLDCLNNSPSLVQLVASKLMERLPAAEATPAGAPTASVGSR